MFLKGKHRRQSFMKMFMLEWKMFFKELNDTLGNFWKKHCPKLCKCNDKKEK